MRTVLALMLMPIAAMAEPQPAVQALMHYADGVAGCVEAASDAEAAQACRGAASTICMDSEEAGYSTTGMMFCTLAENEAWDRLLNQTYQETMAGLRDMDADEAEYFPEFANRAEALLTAQRAWITYRDAECGLAYAMWGSGSMRQIAGASCLLEMTSTRVIELRFLGDFMR